MIPRSPLALIKRRNSSAEMPAVFAWAPPPFAFARSTAGGFVQLAAPTNSAAHQLPKDTHSASLATCSVCVAGTKSFWRDVCQILPRNFRGHYQQLLFQFAHIFFVSADCVPLRNERFDMFKQRPLHRFSLFLCEINPARSFSSGTISRSLFRAICLSVVCNGTSRNFSVWTQTKRPR